MFSITKFEAGKNKLFSTLKMKEAPLYERPFLTYKITGFHKADGYKLFLV
jgi:hypothetical protein